MTKHVGLVTGASSGIGEQLARLLAKDGHDVVLVARSSDKLEALASELRSNGTTQAWVVTADLTDPAAPGAIFEATSREGLAIDFLFNNAGFGSNGAFFDLPMKGEVDMVQVNVQALIELTRLYGLPMRQRRFGRILNIASTAGFQPGPFMATYYATKAFVISWGQALAYELRDTGVTVTTYCPGPVATGFAQRAGNDKSKLFQRSGAVASAEKTAAQAYRATMAGKELSVQGAVNWIGTLGARMTPGLSRSIAASMNRR